MNQNSKEKDYQRLVAKFKTLKQTNKNLQIKLSQSNKLKDIINDLNSKLEIQNNQIEDLKRKVDNRGILLKKAKDRLISYGEVMSSAGIDSASLTTGTFSTNNSSVLDSGTSLTEAMHKTSNNDGSTKENFKFKFKPLISVNPAKSQETHGKFMINAPNPKRSNTINNSKNLIFPTSKGIATAAVGKPMSKSFNSMLKRGLFDKPFDAESTGIGRSKTFSGMRFRPPSVFKK